MWCRKAVIVSGQTFFQRRHPLGIQDAAVDVSEDVPKPKVLAEDVG